MSKPPSALPPNVASESSLPSVQPTTPSRNVAGGNASNKIEIKVSAEGVAKLTFNFLDEQGDSSLEPGEVKTPPHATSASPVPPPPLAPPSRSLSVVAVVEKPKSPIPKQKAAPPVTSCQDHYDDVVLVVAEERSKPKPEQATTESTVVLSAKVPLLKSVSQRDAAACEEKVRAILELDAIKRREEAEQRKQQLEKRRRSGELLEDEETKKKAKEERKRLKRLKKEQKTARLALLSDDELDATAAAVSDEENGATEKSQKKKKIRHLSKEHLYSTTSTHSSPERHHHDELRSVVNSVAISPATRYPPMPMSLPPGPPPHLSPYPTDSFMGYRPMNPFIRGPRPDFHHSPRGMFMPRGRGGGMRGSMRFPAFRPPFYSSGVGGPPRHHGPPMTRPHTPPPARGHSPIQPPNANLIWTKTKPAISYAFKPREDCNKSEPEQKAEDTSAPALDKSQKNKDKSARAASKLRKKAKKQHEREKVKKRRSSRNSSEKSSKRKIEKIRKSLAKKPMCRRPNTPELIPEIIQKRSEEQKELASKTTTPPTPCTPPTPSPPPTTTNKRPKLDEEKPAENVVIDKQEMWNVLENIKIEKVDVMDMVKEITPPLELIKDTIKTEVKIKDSNALTFKIDNKTAVVDANVFAEADYDDEDNAKKPTLKNRSLVLKDGSVTADDGPKDTEEDENAFDIFADSPRRIAQKPTSKDIENLLSAARKRSEIKDVSIERKHRKIASSGETNEIIAAETPESRTPPPKCTQLDRGNTTPPLPPLHSVTKADEKTPEKTPLQKAIEIQKRIDKMLQGDDFKIETIQASKEKLLRKTKEHEEKSSQLRGIMLSKEAEKLEKSGEKQGKLDGKQEKSGEKQEKPRHLRQRSLTPEPAPPKHHNPFKRSISRDCFFGKIDSVRRSRSRERDTKSKRKLSSERSRSERDRLRAISKGRHSGGSSTGSLNRSFSGERSVVYRGSLNRSHSKEHERNERGSAADMKRRSDPKRKLSKSPRGIRRRRTISQDKSKSLERQNKTKRSLTPPTKHRNDAILPTVAAERPEKEKTKIETPKKSSTKKSKKSTPLSFTASEFLFPEENAEDEETNNTRKAVPKLTFKSGQVASKKNSRKALLTSTAGESPDTDDYMDNWENDDADIDVHSSTACDSSTPVRSSQEDVDDKFVTRYVNPSPPMELQHQNDKVDKAPEESTTPTSSPPLLSKPKYLANDKQTDVTTIKARMSRNAFNKELFGMQELYDQFIKSVEESGVDMKTAQSQTTCESSDGTNILGVDQTLEERANEEHLSTSSTSTTSSSSSSSSSDASNSSSSSSSSSSASSSDDSNDAESFVKTTTAIKMESPKPTVPIIEVATVAVDVGKYPCFESDLPTSELPPPIQDTLTTDSRPVTPCGTPPPPPVVVRNTAAIQSSPPPQLPLVEVMPSPTPSPAAVPVKTQKSNVAKDFKKLKSLEANLARIQMMRANYDSADEISEELLKMEKLFLQEKNLILQKYAKKTTTATETATTMAPATPPSTSGKFVISLQQTDNESEPPPIDNKIFDVNREAIKLTISPMKLPKTPAIFEKAEDHEAEKTTTMSRHSKMPVERDEMDITEKLIKPAKEIAIVKPMMETKESRSSHHPRQRHSSPPPAPTRSGDRPRSPTGSYRDRTRQRSDSRSRLSPAQSRSGRGGRVRSLSGSPPRRAVGARKTSPLRLRSTQSTRFRTSGRRSRSRSITRTSNRRGNGSSDLSPPSHRRRRGEQQQRTSGQPGHGFSHRKPSTQHQRSMRSSRSRSPRSPAPLQIRPHSPRSPPPPPSRRRSYSRERYSRSPLPFKPPSPPMPMRRSHSPPLRRPSSMSPPRSSCGGGRRSPVSHSRSPRSPRSPPIHSRYDERDRRHRDNSYDRRSSQSPLQRQYYGQDGVTSSSSSMHYYNVSPNRISLDARINIVLNGPTNQDGTGSGGGGGANIASYESYSNYSQYGGGAAYMSVPPHPSTSDGGNYYANQYVAQSSHPQQQVYSNIPTISGSGGSGSSAHSPALHHSASNFYYNEFGGHPAVHHHSASVLKELPKAGAVAVQKGNVLEIVPSSELPSGDVAAKSSTVTEKTSAGAQAKSTKEKSSKVSWKEEVNSRHVTAAVLRLSRETDGASRSILKRGDTVPELPKIEKLPKKKVYFEDGIFPNRDSEDEDRKMIDYRIRRKVQRLRKRHGSSSSLITSTAADKENRRRLREAALKIDPALEKLAPPPAPPGVPSSQTEQPIYLRPPTPTPLFYFHFDAVVHSMYVSQLERAIPPRLLNPKCVPGGSSGSTAAAATQSPSSAAQSPIGNKKDLRAVSRSSARNSSGRAASPKTMPAAVVAQHPPLPVSSGNNNGSNNIQSPLTKGTFQAIAATSPLSPQISAAHSHPPHPHHSPRQTAPIGFVGMRINNFMRLPPSPLARGPHPHVHAPPPPGCGGAHLPIIGMRHSYNMPPPMSMPMLPPPPMQHQHSHEFSGSATQSYPPPPSSHHMPPYAAHNAQGPPLPPPHHYHAPHAHHQQHHRQPPPGYFMQSAQPPMQSAQPPMPQPPPPLQATSPTSGVHIVDSSPQAMVAPFNLKRTS